MVRVLLVFIFSIGLFGCTADIAIEDLNIPSVIPPESSISVSSTVPADGVSVINVTVTFEDPEGNRVSGITPTYSIISGSGLSGSACTTSSASGISYCQFTSTVSGTKTIEFGADFGGESASLVFTYGAQTNTYTQFASAGKQLLDGTSGYKVSSTLGNYSDGLIDGSGGWTIWMGIQGKIESDADNYLIP